VKPGVTYGYRVAALTEEVFVPSDQRRSPFSSQVSVVAATDFRLTILTTDESKKSIELQVEKWHNNRWWTKVFEVSQGDTIGSFDEGSGVDYSTGQRVDLLEFTVETRREPRSEVVFDKDGRVMLEGSAPLTEILEQELTFTKTILRVAGGVLPVQTLEHEQKR
jgi:hypothetical protein